MAIVAFGEDLALQAAARTEAKHGAYWTHLHTVDCGTMAITSIAELERAREVLASRPAAELADFILSLAVESDGISEYVHAFVLSADTKAAAELLSSELRFLKNGERDRDYRCRKGAGHVARANRWLDAIDRSVLSSDPLIAMQLLTQFMESGEQIAEHCWDDDFGMSQLFTRAWSMAKSLATKMPESDVNVVLDRLRGGFAASMVEVVE